jgi:hypothetical protein
MEHNESVPAAAEETKKVYETPSLVDLGGVEDITQTGTGFSVDFN